MVGRPAVGVLLAVLSGVSAEASRYRLIRDDGTAVAVEAVGLVHGQAVAVAGGDVQPLDGDEVDFRATFLANLGDAGADVVFFRSGGWLRFEEILLDGGRATLELTGGGRIGLDEEVLDYRRTVLEAGTLELPSAVGRTLMTAKGKSQRVRRTRPRGRGRR